jgi:hypothetical protein
VCAAFSNIFSFFHGNVPALNGMPSFAEAGRCCIPAVHRRNLVGVALYSAFHLPPEGPRRNSSAQFSAAGVLALATFG